MVASTEAYGAWAELLRYPHGVDAPRLREQVGVICAAAPEFADDLQPLLDFIEQNQDSELEEVFTRTFDSNAERALEVGWHLHGENYARGVFMVRMRGLLRQLAVPESSELPDHLSHVLQVLARAEQSVSRALAGSVVSPALAKILEGFGDQTNPYFGVVRGLKKFIDDRRKDTTHE
jgi:nitrate reductase assembly molybdenum cofactor insertion protein NarJ